MIETIVGMLASAATGAGWASCATDFGLKAATDRFSQIKPKVLLTVNGYFIRESLMKSVVSAI